MNELHCGSAGPGSTGPNRAGELESVASGYDATAREYQPYEGARASQGQPAVDDQHAATGSASHGQVAGGVDKTRWRWNRRSDRHHDVRGSRQGVERKPTEIRQRRRIRTRRSALD
jgi:hypothetical protein